MPQLTFRPLLQAAGQRAVEIRIDDGRVHVTFAADRSRVAQPLRNPLDQTSPETPGVKTAALVGNVRTAPASKSTAPVRRTARATAPAGPVTQTVPMPEPLPTVEVIRGDKRAQEVIK